MFTAPHYNYNTSAFHEIIDSSQSVERKTPTIPLFNATNPPSTNSGNCSPYMPNLPIPTNSDLTYTYLENKPSSNSTPLIRQWEHDPRGQYNSQIDPRNFQPWQESADWNYCNWKGFSHPNYHAYKHINQPIFFWNIRGPNTVLDDFSPYYSRGISNILARDDFGNNNYQPYPNQSANVENPQEKYALAQYQERRDCAPYQIANGMSQQSRPDIQVRKGQDNQIEKRDSNDNPTGKKRGRKKEVPKNEALVSFPGGMPLFTVPLQQPIPPTKRSRGRPRKPPHPVAPVNTPVVAPEPKYNESVTSYLELPNLPTKPTGNDFDPEICAILPYATSKNRSHFETENSTCIPIIHGASASCISKDSHENVKIMDAPISKKNSNTNVPTEKRKIAFAKDNINDSTKLNQSSLNAPSGNESRAKGKDAVHFLPSTQRFPNGLVPHPTRLNEHSDSSGVTVHATMSTKPISASYSKLNREAETFENTKKILRDHKRNPEVSAPCREALPVNHHSSYIAKGSSITTSGSQEKYQSGEGRILEDGQVIKNASANMIEPNPSMLNIFDMLNENNDPDKEDEIQSDSLSDLEDMISIHITGDNRVNSSSVMKSSKQSYVRSFLSEEESEDDDSASQNPNKELEKILPSKEPVSRSSIHSRNFKNHTTRMGGRVENSTLKPESNSAMKTLDAVSNQQSKPLSLFNTWRGIRNGSSDSDSPVVGSSVETVIIGSSYSNKHDITHDNVSKINVIKQHWNGEYEEKHTNGDPVVPTPPTSSECILGNHKNSFVSLWQEITKLMRNEEGEPKVQIQMSKKTVKKRIASCLSTPIPAWKYTSDDRTSAFVKVSNLSLLKKDSSLAQNDMRLENSEFGTGMPLPATDQGHLNKPCIRAPIMKLGEPVRTMTPTYSRTQSQSFTVPQCWSTLPALSPTTDYQQSAKLQDVEDCFLAPIKDVHEKVHDNNVRNLVSKPHIPTQPDIGQALHTLERTPVLRFRSSSYLHQDDVPIWKMNQEKSRCRTNPMIKKLMKFAKSQNHNIGKNKTKTKLNADLNKVFLLGCNKPKCATLGNRKLKLKEVLLEIPGPIERRALVPEFPKKKKERSGTSMNKGMNQLCSNATTPSGKRMAAFNPFPFKSLESKYERGRHGKRQQKNAKTLSKMLEKVIKMKKRQQKSAQIFPKKADKVKQQNKSATAPCNFDENDADVLDIHAERDDLLDMFDCGSVG